MVTVGMNYEVIEGKNEAFERKFALVVEAMAAMPDHLGTRLFQCVGDRQAYLVVSEWSDRAGFDAFVASEEFARVTRWGAGNILSARPRHEVYEAGGAAPVGGGCPAHAVAG